MRGLERDGVLWMPLGRHGCRPLQPGEPPDAASGQSPQLGNLPPKAEELTISPAAHAAVTAVGHHLRAVRQQHLAPVPFMCGCLPVLSEPGVTQAVRSCLTKLRPDPVPVAIS
jgi:hypothetical protein